MLTDLKFLMFRLDLLCIGIYCVKIVSGSVPTSQVSEKIVVSTRVSGSETEFSFVIIFAMI